MHTARATCSTRGAAGCSFAPASIRTAPKRALQVAASPDGKNPSASPTTEPSRHIPLHPSSNAMWLLDFLQDQFYDIRGPNFIIQRAESDSPEVAQRVRKTKLGGLAKSQAPMSMVHKVMWKHPGSIMLLEGATVDISDFLEVCPEEPETPEASYPATTCTGIVYVPQATEDTAEEDMEEMEVFYTNSTSPRRTKMVGFTCKCCGARNFNSVNPQSFHSGTLVAQCAKCERWHKLSDHFGLFHDLKGPLFRKQQAVKLEDVPPSLRVLDPALWPQDDDMYTP